MSEVHFFHKLEDRSAATILHLTKGGLNKYGQDYKFDHVCIELTTGEIIWFKFSLYDPRDFDQVKDDNTGKSITTFELPIPDHFIINKRKEIGTLSFMKKDDYYRMWALGYNPKSFFRSNKRAMSCSNVVAYCLGIENYYELEPDDLFNILSKYFKN